MTTPTQPVHAKDELKRLRAEIDTQQNLIRQHSVDWAEAHTHAQTVAKRVGVPESEVEGDSYGVPGIEDLVDMIAARRSHEVNQYSAFEAWWHNEGSAMAPMPDEDAEAHVHRVCKIAWMNGAYVAEHGPATSVSEPLKP